jgi:hypothetical protein
MQNEKERNLTLIHNEVEKQLANPQVLASLVATTFKGLTADLAKRAIVEGMIRGYSFKDFLDKNIYAIPFSSGYSLITSIDYARKIGARSGVVGETEPSYETTEDGKIISCTITIKKMINGYVGDFTAKCYFAEYYKAGKNGYPSLWDTKPRTMIAKVTEVHGLRKACPEELSQAYVEEEIGKEEHDINSAKDKIIAEGRFKIEECKTEEDLKEVWANLPVEIKEELNPLKEEIKAKVTTKKA